MNMHRAHRTIVILSIVAVFHAAAVRAADVTSTYSGPSANWTTALWLNVPPIGGYPDNGHAGVATYDAIFNGSGTLTLDQNIAIQMFTLSGTVTGSFNLTTNDLLHDSGGTLSGTGINNANGGMQIDGYQSFVDTRTINVAGSSSFTGYAPFSNGYLYLSNGATLNNSGTFDAGWATNFSNNIAPNGPAGTFNNSGTFTRSIGTGTTTISVPFNNSNVVTVQAGTLLLNGGGTESGSFQVASGATLNFNGPLTTLAAGTTLNGPGTTMISGTASVTGPAVTYSGGGLLQVSGTLTGAGTLTSSAPVELYGGTMSGAGITNINSDLSIDGYQNFIDTRTINVAGSSSFTGYAPYSIGYLYLSNGATLNNSGTFDAGWATNLNNTIIPNGPVGTFNNSGTFTRSVGTGTTTVSVPFNNSNVVTVQAGTLLLNGGGTETGSFQVASGATLNFGGPVTTLAAGTTLSGPGTTIISGTASITGPAVTYSGGGLLQVSGTLTGAGTLTATAPVELFGGTMSGTGITNVNSDLSIDGYVNYLDARTINVAGSSSFTGYAPYSIGYLYMSNGATLNNSGTFDAGWAANLNNNINNNGGTATFNNSGTFTRSVGTGTTTVNIPFNSSGAVIVQAGTLALGGGGTESGSIQVAAGATLSFSGSTTLTNAASLSVGGSLNILGPTTLNSSALTGTGTVNIPGSGTLTVTSTVTNGPALSIVGGTLNGGGALTVGGALHWTDGTMSGAGITTANGGAQFDGYQEFLDGRTLNIGGPATFTGNAGAQTGYLYITNGATLNNSSTFDSGWAGNFNNNIAPNGAPGTFNNSGTFTRSVGSGTTSVTVPFNNSGIVNVQAGTLALSGGGMDSGSFQVPAGGTLGFAGTTTLTSAASLSVGGSLNISGPTTLNTGALSGAGTINIPSNGTLTVTSTVTNGPALNLAGGTLNGGGAITFGGAMHWTDGTMSGAGTTTANGAAQFDGYQEFLDGRTLNIGAPATFTGNAGAQTGYLYITNGATLNNSSTFDSGWATNFNNNIAPNGVPGTFNNQGTFTRSVGSGTTTVSVPFVNNGIVDLKVGTLELAGGLSVGNNSLLKVSAGVLKINSNSGTPNVGSGAMALISGTGVLQLAGSVSALGVASPAANRVAISNDSTAAAGLVVSGVNQQVGAISGSGNVQVNGGASLIADSISAAALLIGGAAGNPAKVTIAGSDTNGQPLGEGFANAAGADLSATGFAALSTSAVSLDDGGSTFDLNRASDYRAPNAANPNSLAFGNNAVPEPASIALTLAGVLGLSSVALRRRNQKKPRDGRPWA